MLANPIGYMKSIYLSYSILLKSFVSEVWCLHSVFCYVQVFWDITLCNG